MNEGINLLDPNKKSAVSAAVKRMEGLRFLAGSLLFFVSVASVILFILVAISPLPSLQKQQHSLELTLSNSKNDIAKLAYINERTTAINEVLTKRESLDQTLTLVQSKLSSNTKVTAIKADKNVLTLTVESKSLQSLDNFINAMIDYVQNKQGFSKVTLTELSSDDLNNVYSVTINLVLL